MKIHCWNGIKMTMENAGYIMLCTHQYTHYISDRGTMISRGEAAYVGPHRPWLLFAALVSWRDGRYRLYGTSAILERYGLGMPLRSPKIP
jgi:hypothetical protein